ncbi:unnamed protein product [Durusdinium trenchii]|uniref:WW domain-containing protein n=2 Tax=Durusdinium trenchii TaxID=1381693 RepID=A0ABP0SJI0_9DINO
MPRYCCLNKHCYCCKACAKWEKGGFKKKTFHGPQCQRELAPENAPRKNSSLGATEAWRKMWITTEFTGKVVLQVRDEEEFLAIDSPDCMARYGSIPEILDDGRTIGLALGDTVAFGICPQKETLVAVNVWRVKRPRTQGKPKAAKDEEVRGPLRMLGWAKANKGHYRILCKDLFELYGRDAEIAPEEVPSDLRSGDWISFLVEEPQTSSDALSATDIQVLSKPPAPVPMGDGEDLDAKQLKLSREPALESLGADSSAPSREDTQDLRTPEEWAGAQERLFGHLPALPPKWIRIVGKSTGKVFFYNMITGESTSSAPPTAEKS